MPKIPEARHWALRLANEWRSSSTTAGPPLPPPPSPASGFAPESGFSVAGSLADGGSVVISDTSGAGRFGVKPHGARPLLWCPFEVSLNGSAAGRLTGDYTGNTRQGLSAEQLYPNSAAAYRADLASSGDASIVAPHGDKDKVYIWQRKYYPYQFNGTYAMNLKPWRHWATTGTDGTGSIASPYIMNGWQASEGGTITPGNPRFSNTPTEVTKPSASYRGHRQIGNRWITDERLIRQSTVGVSDGVVRWIRDGLDFSTNGIGRAYPESWCTRTSESVRRLALAVEDQRSNTIAFSPISVFWDAYYMDDSWCRVLVSDEPNYRDYQEAIASAVDPAYPGPMVTRDPQLVTEWSPHQIECTLRIGGRASFVGEFLYVVTDSDVQLKIGEFTA